MISTAFANRILSSIHPTIQLHTGDPGPNGKAFIARGVDPRPVTLTVKGETATNADPVVWLHVTAMETFTHFTAWDNGLLFTGTVGSGTVFAGDNVFIDPGALTVHF